MSACLLDCLREAHLEQYFASFVQRGVTNCEHLMALSMPDYPHFGVTTMESRVKLFKLIQIVKSVQADGIKCKHDNFQPEQNGAIKKMVSLSTDATAHATAHAVAPPPRVARKTEQKKNVEFKPGSDEPIFHCRKALNFSDVLSDDDEEEGIRIKRKVEVVSRPVPSTEPRSHPQPAPSQDSVHLSKPQINDPLPSSARGVRVVDLKPETPSNKTDKQLKKVETSSALKNQYKPLKFFVDLDEASKDEIISPPKPPLSAIMLSEPKQPSNENLVHPGKRITGVTSSNHAYFPTRSPDEKITHRQKVFHNSGYNYGLPQGNTPCSPGKRRKSDKICVCVRKRPMTTREAKRGDVDVVSMSSGKQVVVEEKKMSVDLSAYIQEHVFTFDQVFSENSSNHDVYLSAVKPLVTCVFDRGAATCFAFGQTGSGKTHTLLGSRGSSGVYQLAAADILQMIQSVQLKDLGLKLWVSFYEIYNSQLYDLLNKRKRLFVRENGKHKVCIAGLMETQVTSIKGLTEVVRYGNASRSTGASAVNPHSSRSHAILQMEVRDGREFKVGRLSFIDLAGSERATDANCQSSKQTRMEGAEINQSLLALKECIRSLDQASSYTPYRQSKLTHILRESFTGNCRTVMIANVSPTLSASDNTLNTLRYADR
ncbi:hypothetical protein CAPTEDRAFT_172954 [Capitella teleta]|uniref:Kinesin-like protein n=1 Tax=Capitella teleta TaxID=283909 RepID=R7VKK0_CAPTE|nr:hypothetical protein CAPTEDRAFT_172954 [Capitella teleta]|eukprot:ELU16830.1 hypothetical protein CAPTEDRAFT_172954 [Capitella teleta]